MNTFYSASKFVSYHYFLFDLVPFLLIKPRIKEIKSKKPKKIIKFEFRFPQRVRTAAVHASKNLTKRVNENRCFIAEICVRG